MVDFDRSRIAFEGHQIQIIHDAAGALFSRQESSPAQGYTAAWSRQRQTGGSASVLLPAGFQGRKVTDNEQFELERNKAADE